jgi:large repetitive protein
LPLNTIAPQVLETTCARPGDTRTYRLTMVNTNVHSYENITVTVALPMGLRFSRAISGTTTPQLISESDGRQTVRWVGQRINAKPNGVFAAQVEYWMELSVGNVLGDLPTVAAAISPDGLIPRKDDATDPSVPMCAPNAPAMVKAVNRPQVTTGGGVVYQITLANPTGSPINTTVGDPLPFGFSYVGMVSGPEPAVNGSNLTWNSVGVPAAVNGTPGVASLVFRVLTSGETGQTYTNTAVSSGGVDATQARAPVLLTPPQADLNGVVFNDLNSNGVVDGGETGIANATVTLTLSSGVLVTQTNSQGAYGFYAVSAGSYIVEVGSRANLIHTSPQSVAGTMAPGTTTTVNFGFGTVAFISINDISVAEGNAGTTAMVFNVTLSKVAGVTVTANFATANVSAVAPGDYTAISGTAMIAPGTTSTQVTVLVNGDAQTEPNETLVVNLTAPANAALLDGQGQGTITNDDGVTPPSSVYVSIDDATPIAEGNSGTRTATFRVWLSPVATKPVTVSFRTADFFALAGSDYVAQQGQLVIPAGSTEGFINVTVNGDTVYEAEETFYVNLMSAENALLSTSGQGKGTIQNDDLPVFTTSTINITDATLLEGNTSTGQRMRFTVVLTSSTANTVTVNYKTVSTGSATAGTDYEDTDSATGTPLTFAPGQTIAFVYVQVFGDTAREPGETFNVTLSGPVGGVLGRATASGTILDDDGPRVFAPYIRK